MLFSYKHRHWSYTFHKKQHLINLILNVCSAEPFIQNKPILKHVSTTFFEAFFMVVQGGLTSYTMTLAPAIPQPNSTVVLTLSVIIKNIHYKSLRCLRLKSIGGQNLKLPRGPNYTIQKKCFDYLFRCLLHGDSRGLTAYTITLALPCHRQNRTVALWCCRILLKIFITSHYDVYGIINRWSLPPPSPLHPVLCLLKHNYYQSLQCLMSMSIVDDNLNIHSSYVIIKQWRLPPPSPYTYVTPCSEPWGITTSYKNTCFDFLL